MLEKRAQQIRCLKIYSILIKSLIMTFGRGSLITVESFWQPKKREEKKTRPNNSTPIPPKAVEMFPHQLSVDHDSWHTFSLSQKFAPHVSYQSRRCDSQAQLQPEPTSCSPWGSNPQPSPHREPGSLRQCQLTKDLCQVRAALYFFLISVY